MRKTVPISNRENIGLVSVLGFALDVAAEIYPGIATEPVGGTGLKATGLEASRS